MCAVRHVCVCKYVAGVEEGVAMGFGDEATHIQCTEAQSGIGGGLLR